MIQEQPPLVKCPTPYCETITCGNSKCRECRHDCNKGVAALIEFSTGGMLVLRPQCKDYIPYAR